MLKPVTPGNLGLERMFLKAKPVSNRNRLIVLSPWVFISWVGLFLEAWGGKEDAFQVCGSSDSHLPSLPNKDPQWGGGTWEEIP